MFDRCLESGRHPTGAHAVGRRSALAVLAMLTVVAAASVLPRGADAHHGWRWTAAGNFELTGIIRESRLGMPHGELIVDVEGEMWTVEVGQPWRNERAGLTNEMLSVGKEITASGGRSSDSNEKLLKAERIIIAGKVYDLYPNRD